MAFPNLAATRARSRSKRAGALACALLTVSTWSLACRRATSDAIRIVPQVGVVHPRRLQFSPTHPNRLLVMEATGLVGVWDVANPKEPELFASIRGGASNARFSPDGKGIVTVGLDGYVRWWNSDGSLRWTSTGRHDGWARAVAVSATRIVTGGEDEKIRFWTTDGAVDGEPLQAHTSAVLSIDIAPNGDLVSMGSDEVLRLWKADPQGGAPYTEQVLYRDSTPAHTQMLPSLLRLDVQWGWDRAAIFSPHGDTIAAVLFDGAVRLFNADGTPRSVMEKAHGGHHVRALDFFPDGSRLASVGFDGGVRVWNRDGSPYGSHIEAHRGPALGVAITADGQRIASAGVDDMMRFWTAEGGALGEFPRARSDRLRSFAIAPRSRVLACGDVGGEVNLWNLDGSPNGRPFPAHRGGTSAIAFSTAEDLVVTGGKDATVRVARRNGTLIASPFTGHIDGVISVAVSPDATLIASGSRNDALRVWDATGNQRHALQGLRDMITDIEFSPDGTLFAAADAPGEIMVWNADGTVHTNVFKAHGGYLADLAFSPDGTVLASAGADKQVKLWGIDGSARGNPLSGHLAPVRSVAFAPGGRTLASGSLDGTVRLWDLSTREARVLFVGISVDQVGFLGEHQMWVRTDGETLLIYDLELRLRATLVLRRDGVLAFTPEGWFFGPPDIARFVRAYSSDGQRLSDAASAARYSPGEIRAAVAAR